MKLNKNILLVGSVALAMVSCDALDLYPEAAVTPNSFFKSERDLELFTNNFYPACLFGQSMNADVCTYKDETDLLITPQLRPELSGQRTTPATDKDLITKWSWGALRQINYFLENSTKCSDVEAREHYQGVARFFRAQFYYYKIQHYGDVPWYDFVIGSADEEALTKPRDPRAYVVGKMIEDLDWAAEHLRTTKDVYRVTRWTAIALKSRVCLFEGTWAKYHGTGDEAYWKSMLEECVKASAEVMDKGGYSLITKGSNAYQTVFNTMNASDNAAEIIFARDYNYNLDLWNGVQDYEFKSGSGCSGATRYLADSYLMKDGSRFTDKENYMQTPFNEECRGRDPRMAQTLITPETKGLDCGNIPDMAVAKLGYQPIKYYVDKSYIDKSFVDMPLIRLAEIYLNYAEAKAELGTITQADLDKTINKIRDRAGLAAGAHVTMETTPDEWLRKGYPSTEAVDPDNLAIRLEIRRERTVELFMEGFRYFDLMRWKEGHRLDLPYLGTYFPGPGEYDLNGDGKLDVLLYKGDKPMTTAPVQLKIGDQIFLTDDSKNEGDSGNLVMHLKLTNDKAKWDDNRDYLYALPTSDITLTHGALKQNPGWGDGGSN